MKNGMAVGPFDVMVEVIKVSKKTSSGVWEKQFDMILDCEKMPEEWRNVLVVL